MQSIHLRTIVVMGALCGLGACSQGAAPAQASAVTDPPAAAVAASGDTGSKGAIANPCDLITAADMAGILSGFLKSERESGMPGRQACQYETGSANISIITAQIDNEIAWTIATTASDVDIPQPGVGDAAMRNASGSKLAARKDGLYCGIEVLGYYGGAMDRTITSARGAALAAKFGALCNKLFAAR